MTVYVDTNTFSATPMLYGDADKKKPLPRVIPSVLLNEGVVRIGFLGDYAPSTGVETVCAVASIPAPGNPLRVVTSYGSQVGDLWEIPINFDAAEIADALVNRGSVNLSMGIIVEGADTRREYQFWVQCFSSAQGEISPEETADAKTFADAARLSADNAAESESNAAQSATHAAEFATASAQSASASATSASNAKASEDNAKASEDNAATSATNAAQSASDAAQSKTDAQSSASSATQSASNASNSASSANTSAVNASNSATAAATSANNASQSASAAKTSETNAKASETAAKASETEAANSASSASTSATNAANSASSASASATNAGNSAVAAAESAEQAAESAEALANVYTKPEIDGVDTGAEVTPKMNEIIAQLKEWEEATGETLPNEFWEKLMAEFQRWQTNPTEVKEWVTTSATESTNPYFSEAPTKPVVDFSVTKAVGFNNSGAVVGSFRGANVIIAIPSATSVNRIFGSSGIPILIAPNATDWQYAYNGSSANVPVYGPSATDLYGAFYFAREQNKAVHFPKANRWASTLSNAYKYNQKTEMPNATNATGCFTKTAMTPDNISATLDTLKDLASEGSTGTISFSRYDGTLLAPLMAESPYVESVNTAVAKGWTVQFD